MKTTTTTEKTGTYKKMCGYMSLLYIIFSVLLMSLSISYIYEENAKGSILCAILALIFIIISKLAYTKE